MFSEYPTYVAEKQNIFHNFNSLLNCSTLVDKSKFISGSVIVTVESEILNMH